jgi:hypothetical protein
MRRWLFPTIGAVAIGAAVTVGALVMSSGSGSTECDTTALAEAMRASIVSADRDGARQIMVDMPAACGNADAAGVLPQVSRSWHVMPGGMMMRELQHAGP